jgi:uncharacterized protein YbjT (DUF2867 family)
MCWVDYRDVAEVVALATTDTALSYGTFELCAPGLIDGRDTAAILTEVVGRPITAVQTPLDEFPAQPPRGPRRDGFRRMMIHYDQCGLPGGNAIVLRTILGRQPRTLKDYFRELADRRAAKPVDNAARGHHCTAVRPRDAERTWALLAFAQWMRL